MLSTFPAWPSPHLLLDLVVSLLHVYIATCANLNYSSHHSFELKFITCLSSFQTSGSQHGGRISQGTFDRVWRHFWLLHPWCYNWHLVDGGQGCCSASCGAQDSPPTTKHCPAQSVSRAEVEKSCSRWSYLRIRTFYLFLAHSVVRSVT